MFATRMAAAAFVAKPSLCRCSAATPELAFYILNTGTLSQYSATYGPGEGMPLLQVRAISASTVPSCVDITAHEQVVTLFQHSAHAAVPKVLAWLL